MSLHDFALRKKKQHEGMELSMSMQGSPMSTTSALGEVDACDEGDTKKDLAAMALVARVRVDDMTSERTKRIGRRLRRIEQQIHRL